MTFSVEIVKAAEISSGGQSVEVHIDRVSLMSLINRLKMLADGSEGDHLHLMSESWGPGDLTEIAHGEENVITHHLKVVLE